MRKFILLCASLCAMLVLISASPVRAQNVAWVAPTGNDTNACSETAPCLTFAGASTHSNVVQINCLTSGNYGPLSIVSSIVIDCGTGNIGTVIGANSSGLSINIDTTVAVTIVLRHLSLSAGANGFSAIGSTQFASGTLIVEDCTIHGYPGPGINFQPLSGRGLLEVSDSEIFGNQSGIVAQPASGQIASVTLDHVKLTGNTQNGLVLGGAGVVAGTMRNSVAGSNTLDGVLANAGQVFFTVEESSIVANLSNGIQANSAGSNLNVTASTISGNGTGVLGSAGSLVSFGNNTLNGNGADGHFTSTSALK